MSETLTLPEYAEGSREVLTAIVNYAQCVVQAAKKQGDSVTANRAEDKALRRLVAALGFDKKQSAELADVLGKELC